MKKIVGILSVILLGLLIADCIIFKEFFVYAVTGIVVLFMLIALLLKFKISMVDFSLASWFIICSSLPLIYKYVWKINVFKVYASIIFGFTFGGAIIISFLALLCFQTDNEKRSEV